MIIPALSTACQFFVDYYQYSQYGTVNYKKPVSRVILVVAFTVARRKMD
jgi:hypothetical protein